MSSPDPLASMLPVTRIGRFEVVDRLGSGGMAEVLLAVRRSEGFVRAVALKRALPALAAQARFRAMMRREAQLAALIHHPNCAEVHDFEEEGAECAVVMELLHGLDAAELLRTLVGRGERLSPHAAVRILCDAAKGLHHVHGLQDADGHPLGIVHRDISPHNLFVTDTGLTKILDFGIAKAALATDEITRTGVLKGKFRYMAPEQLAGSTVDARTDVFSLAVSAWELLTGTALFEGGAVQAVDRMKTPVALRLAERPAAQGLPPALLSVLEHALAHAPHLRTPDMARFHDELSDACQPCTHEDVARWVDHAGGDRVRERRAQVRRVSRLRVSGELTLRSGETSPEDTPIPAHRRTKDTARIKDTIRLEHEATREVGSPAASPRELPLPSSERLTVEARVRQGAQGETAPGAASIPSTPRAPALALAPTQPGLASFPSLGGSVSTQAMVSSIDSRGSSLALPRDTLPERPPEPRRTRTAAATTTPVPSASTPRPSGREVGAGRAVAVDALVFFVALVAGASAAYWLP